VLRGAGWSGQFGPADAATQSISGLPANEVGYRCNTLIVTAFHSERVNIGPVTAFFHCPLLNSL
jgi:hypothetical protein